MTTTWKVQTQVFPQIFNDSRCEILENSLIMKSQYICELFNNIFELEYDEGNLKEKIEYSSDEFAATVIYGENNNRIFFIEMPEPRQSDFSYSLFTKYYCIPYTFKENRIEILDLYAVEKIKNTQVSLIVFYKDAKHLVSNLRMPVNVEDKENVMDFMCEYIFSHY